MASLHHVRGSASAAERPPLDARAAAVTALRAGLLTALVDGLFSSILVTAFYHSTFARLWQGVASTLLGASAIGGGARVTMIGLAMHVGVALGWSAVFVALAQASDVVRRATATPAGVLAAAVAYGPLVWLVMSLLVIPRLTHRPPTIGFRWWVQLIGHVPAVALPIVGMTALGLRMRVTPQACPERSRRKRAQRASVGGVLTG